MFRDRLKEHSRPWHERLESHPRMTDYASGRASRDAYGATVGRLHAFWSVSQPAGQKMPSTYSILLEGYREALREDSGANATSEPAEQAHYDAVGFYYVLLGSSHGARFMLKNVASGEKLPVRHLQVLAEQAHALWTPFVSDYLQRVEPSREVAVMQAAARMFEDLYTRLGD